MMAWASSLGHDFSTLGEATLIVGWVLLAVVSLCVSPRWTAEMAIVEAGWAWRTGHGRAEASGESTTSGEVHPTFAPPSGAQPPGHHRNCAHRSKAARYPSASAAGPQLQEAVEGSKGTVDAANGWRYEEQTSSDEAPPASGDDRGADLSRRTGRATKQPLLLQMDTPTQLTHFVCNNTLTP